MRKLPLAIAFLLASISLAPAASAQTHPSFAGEWTMIADKSDFGPLPKPTSMTRTITETGATLKIVTVQKGANGDTTVSTTFTTDGKPQKNTVQGSEMTTTGKWDGAAMLFNSSMDMQGAAITIEDRYALSDAGKTLTVTRKFTTPQGAATATIVFAHK